MKRYIIHLTTLLVFLLLPLVSISQVRGPGNPGEDPTGPPVGGGAPVGSGIFVLLIAGAAYGGKKLYTLYHGQKETLEE